MDEIDLISFQPSPLCEIKLYAWSAVFLTLGIVVPSIAIVLIPIAFFLFFKACIRIASTKYKITTQRFFKCEGFIARHEEEVELYRIQDVKLDQSVFQRLCGIGDVVVLSVDKSSPYLLIRGVRDPVKIKETLRGAYKQARKAEGVSNTEFTI